MVLVALVPPFRATPASLRISPALTIVVMPLSVRSASLCRLMIRPPARFSIRAVKLGLSVLEKTASVLRPLAWIRPLLVSWALLPCM